MSVAIPACKFEEGGDVDKNEGQWLTEQLRGVTKQNSVIVRSSHEQSSISGEINEELISIDEIYCWPILNIDLFELILVGTFHLIHHSMCSEWRGGSTTFVQLPWAPIHLGRHHKPGVQSRGRRLLLMLPPSPLPQPVQEPQVVPGLPLPGSHRAGRVHQRLGQRGHHQHREEVPLAVHPVRHHRLLLRHRLPGGDDTGEHFSPDDPADSKSFLLVSSHLWLGMANNTLVTHWLCEISSMFLWDLPHRGGICPSRQCRRQCKIFASGVNFSIFTHCLCFFPLKLLKLSEIDTVNFLAWKYGGVHFWTNSMSDSALQACMRVWSLDVTKLFYFGRLVRCRSQKTNLISSFSKFDRSQKQLEK